MSDTSETSFIDCFFLTYLKNTKNKPNKWYFAYFYHIQTILNKLINHYDIMCCHAQLRSILALRMATPNFSHHGTGVYSENAATSDFIASLTESY
jgi:hypothetical protein